MPRPVLNTYGKKRAVSSKNDANSMAFDKLIQDVSNNTIKKPKLSVTSTNGSNAFDFIDENKAKFNNSPKKITLKRLNSNNNSAKCDDIMYKPTFFKSKFDKSSKKPRSKAKNDNKIETTQKKSKLKIKLAQNIDSDDDGDDDDDEEERNEIDNESDDMNKAINVRQNNDDLNNRSVCSSIQSSRSSTNGSSTGGAGGDSSFLDGPLAQFNHNNETQSQKPQKLFFNKSKSLNTNTTAKESKKLKNNNNEEESSDEEEDKEFEKIIKTKLKLTKSKSDSLNQSLSSANTSSSSLSSPKISPNNKQFIQPKRIFSSNQSKKNQMKLNYNPFSWNETVVKIDEEEINEIITTSSKSSNSLTKSHSITSSSSSTSNSVMSCQITATTSKQEYAILLNTRKAYECEELGETQSFTDDTNYLMDGLNDNFQMANRCMSAIKLAEYCLNSEFRMHLRSQGTITKIFNLLHDSAKDYCLALCTSCLMYTLSRDKLVMDIDKSSLKLMIMLLNMNVPSDKEIENNQLYKKLLSQCSNILVKLENSMNSSDNEMLNSNDNGSIKHIIDHLNANLLAIECLLSLTNRRIGDWYKEELRVLGAFDNIIDIVSKCVQEMQQHLNTTNSISSLNLVVKYTRCLKLLENVTFSNVENQNYLCNHKNSCLIILIKNSLNWFFKKLNVKNLDLKLKKTLSDAIKTTFLLMINLTHNNENGSKKISNDDELINLLFICIQCYIDCINDNEKFDVLIMALGILLNLLHMNKQYQKKFIKKITLLNNQQMTSLDVIIKLFNQKQNEVNEAETDQEKEWSKLNQEIESQNVENINYTVMNSIHKAGKHMEDHIVAAHSAIIIGYLLLADQSHSEMIKSKLNNHTFTNLIEIMKKFLLFMKIMKVTGFSADEHIKEILKTLETLNKQL